MVILGNMWLYMVIKFGPAMRTKSHKKVILM